MRIFEISRLFAQKTNFFQFFSTSEPGVLCKCYVLQEHTEQREERNVIVKCLNSTLCAFCQSCDRACYSQVNQKISGIAAITFLPLSSTIGSCRWQILAMLPIRLISFGVWRLMEASVAGNNVLRRVAYGMTKSSGASLSKRLNMAIPGLA